MLKKCEFTSLICEWKFCESCPVAASDPSIMHEYFFGKEEDIEENDRFPKDEVEA